MKQLIKTIVPRPVLNKAVHIRDYLHFVMSPCQDFNPANLCLSLSLSLSAIFSDKEIEDAWEKDYRTIESLYGNEDRFGGVNPGDRRALYYLIMALNPGKVLEVGTHIGASTLHIARALKHLNSDGKVTSADIIDVNDPETGPWKQLGLKHSPKEYAKKLECSQCIDFVVSPCLEFMNNTEQRFDFIFLDGDHKARAVYQEVSAALPLLKPDGVVLLHDYYPDAKPLYPDDNIIYGPFQALERIKKENSEISVLPLGTLPWPTKQGMNVTSLALVTKM